MAIGTQPAAAHFLPEVSEMFLIKAAFEKGAGVDTWCGVGLKEHQVAALGGLRAAKEMIEADLEDFGGGSVARDVAAELAIRLIGPHDHGEGVPAHQCGEALLECDVARVDGLVVDVD